MKTNDPFDDLLSSWNPPPNVPSDFREQVWHRIAATADAGGTLVARPFRARVAAIAAAAVIVVGFGLGLLDSGSPDSDRAAYFHRIDPIAKAR